LLVSGGVVAVVFFPHVVGPVLIEVAVAVECSQEQDRFGSGQSPAGAGDVEAVFDQESACGLA
jgi:hypothetical protein